MTKTGVKQYLKNEINALEISHKTCNPEKFTWQLKSGYIDYLGMTKRPNMFSPMDNNHIENHAEIVFLAFCTLTALSNDTITNRVLCGSTFIIAKIVVVAMHHASLIPFVSKWSVAATTSITAWYYCPPEIEIIWTHNWKINFQNKNEMRMIEILK